MFDFLELEETVGRAWHRLVGQTRSIPQYPEQAVRLDELAPMLATCFRGFGGDRILQIVPAQSRTSRHRLRLRQLVGLGEERIERPGRDFARVMLPAIIDCFPDVELNRAMYLWLTAAIAALPEFTPGPVDPLQRDLARLAVARITVATALRRFPGLLPIYRRLCAATLSGRGVRTLPAAEKLVENKIISELRSGAGLDDRTPPSIFPRVAPPGYLPMLEVSLWPEYLVSNEAFANLQEDGRENGERHGNDSSKRFAATREKVEGGKRDPFILNRFEKILSMAEMVNVDRPTDDEANEDPGAAEDLDEIVLGQRKDRPSSRFRFDLDLPPGMVDLAAMATTLSYPEWDYRKSGYLKNYCNVLAVKAEASITPQEPSRDTLALVKRVRRQFEALRPRQEFAKSQLDGSELDLDAVVRRQSDLMAGGHATDRIHVQARPHLSDLAVTILVDVSLSTDAWIDNHRVLDVEKEALLVLSHGLSACGTEHSILTFTSRRRSWVKIEAVKGFDEEMSSVIEGRIAGLTPGYYTRLGAALRHSTAEIRKRLNRSKLLLVLTDGKPNDVDHYEGRFALEDTRRAVQEARRLGVNVFAVTVDKEAKSYVPAMFGRNGYAVVGDLTKLPAALPAIYRGVTR